MKERVTVPWRQNTSAAPSQPVKDEVKPVDDGATDQSSPEPAHPQASAVEVIDATVQAQEQPASAAATPDPVSASSASEDKVDAEIPHVRSLAWRNFEQALKEITPSASEALGSLAELRKWNDEFGEGRKAKKRQVWGKDRLGFTVPAPEVSVPPVGKVEPGFATPGNSSSDNSVPDTTARD